MAFVTSSLNAALTSVQLNTAADYAILSGTSITVKDTTSIIGDVGFNGNSGAALTGFAETIDATTGEFALSERVDGKIYALNYAEPTPTKLAQAVSDRNDAIDYAKELTGGTLMDTTTITSGYVFTEGLYTWSAGLALTAPIEINGSSTDVWVFQIGTALTLSATANVTLTGGAIASNIFWYTGTGATFAAASYFEGIILSETAITAADNVTLNSNLYSRTGVTLGENNNLTAVAVPEPVSCSIIAGLSVLALVVLPRRARNN